NFIICDDKVDCYAGQVQYFFKHIVNFENGPVEHNLAYVWWYKPAETSKVQYYFSIDDDKKTCNVELWKNKFYSYCSDSIISIQNILCQFLYLKCKNSNYQNAI